MPPRRSSGRMLAGADGAWFLGTGNDGKVSRSIATARARCSTTAPKWKCTRWPPRRTAGLRRHVARWPHLSRRRQGPGHARSSIPTTSTSGRWSSIATATCSPAPATRARSTRSRPTARARSSSPRRPSHAVSLAFDQNRPAARRHRRAGPRVPRRRAGKGFLLLDTTYQEIHAHSRRSERRDLRRRAKRPRAGRRRLAAETAVTPPPVTPSIPNVSTEITSITVVDVGGVAAGRRLGAAERRSTMTGAVYRVQPDGLWDELWTRER